MPVAFDTETRLIVPGCQAPAMICASFASGEEEVLVHHTEAREVIQALLESDELIVGHSVAFDMSVVAAKWPDLVPLIFEVYAADRITCTELREKLLHLGAGIYRGFEKTDGKWVHLNYSLADLTRRHLGVELEKGDESWQKRFTELEAVPLPFWPEAAREYALADAAATLRIFERQETDAKKYLKDQFRQARAGFWLQLMSCWGLRADPDGVREFAQKTQQKYDEIAAEMTQEGLVRRDGTRDVKAVQARVAAAYTRAGKKVELTSGGKSRNQKPKTDADVCDRSGDRVLERYAELSSLKKTISTDIPLLRRGVATPLQTHFEVLLATGRTASSPNTQNFPTEVGMRECFAPRPGWLYAVADYSGCELRTWSQVCLEVIGRSRMAEFLNAGRDPHIELACRIMGVSYEEAHADYRENPKGDVYFPRQASKSGNFGFPGGLGVKRFVDYARKNYGVVMTEKKAAELRDFWFESWPEAGEYFKWVNDCIGKESVPVIEQLYVGRLRGDVGFTDAANGMFQGLAADLAKAAGFLISRACYAKPESPLYGCRPVNFPHDEFVVEVPDDDRAPEAAEELARLMVLGARGFLPDVPPVAEPMLCRRWSKRAKPVRVNGRLVPWEPDERRAA